MMMIPSHLSRSIHCACLIVQGPDLSIVFFFNYLFARIVPGKDTSNCNFLLVDARCCLA